MTKNVGYFIPLGHQGFTEGRLMLLVAYARDSVNMCLIRLKAGSKNYINSFVGLSDTGTYS